MSIRRCVGFFEVPMGKGESSMCCEVQEVSGSTFSDNMQEHGCCTQKSSAAGSLAF